MEHENKSVRTLESYSNDELKKLYKSFTLYIVTEWLKITQKKKNNELWRVNPTNGKKYEDGNWLRVLNSLHVQTIEMKLQSEKYNDDEQKRKELQYEKVVLNTIDDVLFWFAGGIEELEKNFEAGCYVRDPDELYEELHENDDIDKEYNRATKEEILKFIWETLRFCDNNTLSRLCKLADRKFEFRAAHRPQKNLKIYKYDKDNNLIETFANRAECIEKEGMTKSALSNVLSGKRKSYNGYIYIEETEN